MKRCPTCQKAYQDETLNFCLEDGAPLLSRSESESSRDSGATLVLSNQTESVVIPPPTQVSVPRGAPTEVMPDSPGTIQEQPRYTSPNAHLSGQPPKPSSHVLTAGVTAIAILLLILVGIGIALLMRTPSTEPQAQPGANNSSNVSNGNASPKVNENNQNTTPPSRNETVERGSLNVTASASSTRAPLKAFSYAAPNALDTSLQTAWIEGVPGPGVGEWLKCDFDREVKLNRVLMTPGYFKTAALWKQNNRLAAATFHFSDGSSKRFTFPDLMQIQTLDTGGIRTKFVRVVIDDYYPGTVDIEDTPISQISFEWDP